MTHLRYRLSKYTGPFVSRNHDHTCRQLHHLGCRDRTATSEAELLLHAAHCGTYLAGCTSMGKAARARALSIQSYLACMVEVGVDDAIRSTNTYRDLESTEKGFVSFLLGMGVAGLLAYRSFGVLLVHVQLLRELGWVSTPSGVVGDLIGEFDGAWHVVEAKGYADGGSKKKHDKAKEQARNTTLVPLPGTTMPSPVASACVTRTGALQTGNDEFWAHMWDPPSDGSGPRVVFEQDPALFRWAVLWDIASSRDPHHRRRGPLGEQYVVFDGDATQPRLAMLESVFDVIQSQGDAAALARAAANVLAATDVAVTSVGDEGMQLPSLGPGPEWGQRLLQHLLARFADEEPPVSSSGFHPLHDVVDGSEWTVLPTSLALVHPAG